MATVTDTVTGEINKLIEITKGINASIDIEIQSATDYSETIKEDIKYLLQIIAELPDSADNLKLEQKLAETTTKLETATAELNNAKLNLQKAQVDVEQANKNAQQVHTAAEAQNIKNAAETKKTIDEANARATQATNDNAKAQTKITEATTQIDAQLAQIKELGKEITDIKNKLPSVLIKATSNDVGISDSVLTKIAKGYDLTTLRDKLKVHDDKLKNLREEKNAIDTAISNNNATPTQTAKLEHINSGIAHHGSMLSQIRVNIDKENTRVDKENIRGGKPTHPKKTKKTKKTKKPTHTQKTRKPTKTRKTRKATKTKKTRKATKTRKRVKRGGYIYKSISHKLERSSSVIDGHSPSSSTKRRRRQR